MSDRSQGEALWLVRERVYHEGFERRRDALFDLIDALLVRGSVPAFVHLSLAQLFRRGWGSAYDALADGRLDEPILREIVGSFPLDDGAPLYALVTRVRPRCDAECSPQRGLYYSASRQSAGQPIAGDCAKTLWALARTAEAGSFRTRPTLPGP